MSVHGRIGGTWIRLDSSDLEAEDTDREPEDFEARAHELALATSVQKALLFCSMLDFSIQALLGLDDVDDEDKDFVATLAPAQYLRTIRIAAMFTPIELDEEIGRPAGFVDSVEAGDADLLTYPVQLAIDIAHATQSSSYRLLKVLDKASRRS